MSLLSALLISCILILTGTVIYFTVQSRIMAAKQSELRNQALAIAQYYAEFVSDYGRTKDNVHWLSVFLQRDQKVVVLSNDMHIQLQVGQLQLQSPDAYFKKATHVIQRPFGGTGLTGGLYTQVPVFGDSPKSRPIAYIQLFSGLNTVHRYMNTLLAVLLLGCFFGVMCAAIGGYWITYVCLLPLTKLITTIEGIGVQNLGQRIHLRNADTEMIRVARTFNQMTERLERAFAQQEQFVADASHEIRTPLTAILGHSDRIARWGDTRPEVLQSSVRVIQKEALRLKKLAEDLLTLARNNGPDTYSERYADLDEVVREVVADYRPMYHQIQIDTDLNVTVKCHLAPELLRSIVVNIATNAVKFTPPDGTIQITTYQTETSVVMEVRDTGCGIPKESLPYIFDRFYRVDKARGRRQGGNGLGLSIVKEILFTCGGQMSVDSVVNRGTIVRIQIPRYMAG